MIRAESMEKAQSEGGGNEEHVVILVLSEGRCPSDSLYALSRGSLAPSNERNEAPQVKTCGAESTSGGEMA
jgi:hypothetical protein